jgi:general secretion pathway protein F
VSIAYRYRAVTSAGQIIDGTTQAASRPALLADLHGQRLYPVTIDEVAPVTGDGATQRLGRRPAVTLWARSTATLLRAGMPLERTLAFTGAHAGHAGLAAAIAEVRRSVQSGGSLADALARHPRYFDSLVVASAAAGESTGSLDAILERVAAHLEDSAEVRSAVHSALLYPTLMSVVATVGIIVLLGFVVPRFATVLSDVGGKLPATTRLLMGASAVVTGGWWVWLLLILAAAYAVPRALARPRVRRQWHSARLKIRWAGDFERTYITARFTRTLGLLLRSGIPALPALRIARASVSNMVTRDGIDRAVTAVMGGSPLAASLGDTLPPLARQMLAVGEESGHLDDLCLRVADTYDAEVRRTLHRLVALIEPVMILVFGGLVGFVALALLQAIYGINLNRF